MKATNYLSMVLIVACGATALYFAVVRRAPTDLKPLGRAQMVGIPHAGDGDARGPALPQSEQHKKLAQDFNTGMVLYHQRLYPQARQRFWRVLEQCDKMPPQMAEAIRPTASLYLQLTEATIRQREATRKRANEHLDKGLAALRAGDLADAATSLRKAARASVSMGADKDAALKQALADVEKGLAAGREEAWEDYETGLALRANGQLAEAAAAFERAIRSRVSLQAEAKARARAHLESARKALASQTAEDRSGILAAKTRKEAQAMLVQAEALCDKKQFEQAREALATLRGMQPYLGLEEKRKTRKLTSRVDAALRIARLSQRAPEGMVFVPGGEFVMGADGPIAIESPAHIVNVHAVYMDRHEVTNAEYKKFLDWLTKYGHPRDYCHPREPEDWDHAPRSSDPKAEPYSWKDGTYPPGKANEPVVLVSWFDAYAYARWAGKRLPTEAEWEKAARGTDQRLWPWGDEFEGGRCNSLEAAKGRPTPRGSNPKSASPYGAEDMAGNVWEWCADWYAADYYAASPARDPFGPRRGAERVLRGGAWDSNAYRVRCTKRFHAPPTTRYEHTGFRCVKDAAGE